MHLMAHRSHRAVRILGLQQVLDQRELSSPAMLPCSTISTQAPAMP